jgi:hypothetical protein
MAFAYETAPGAWREIDGPFEIADGAYPYNWPDLATDEELAALGIKPITEPGPPASGRVVTGSALTDVAGAPARSWITEAAPAPPVVTMRQAQLALNTAGHLAAVEAAVAAADAVTRINWATATQLRRDNPLVSTLGTAISLTADDIDALFRAAALIPDP